MLEFWRGKRVLITGDTGFKGTWLTKMLLNAGAKIFGYSTNRDVFPKVYTMCEFDKNPNYIHKNGEIQDLESFLDFVYETRPEFIFHLAAQAIVRECYKNPVYTYNTNVIGTTNVMEAIRLSQCVKSAVIITTDKVYENLNNSKHEYIESDRLNGFDPYSNSKSCAELVVDSYRKSYNITNVSTARAGNVIGGGDFSIDRIIPDCFRAATSNRPIEIRNPYSIRPYQFVLEALNAYLLIAQRQYEENKYGAYNIGPDVSDCVTTSELVNIFCEKWGNGLSWIDINKYVSNKAAPHEDNFLKLNCNKMKETFNWKPTWNITKAIEKTVEWYKFWLDDMLNVDKLMDRQIEEFYNDLGK